MYVLVVREASLVRRIVCGSMICSVTLISKVRLRKEGEVEEGERARSRVMKPEVKNLPRFNLTFCSFFHSFFLPNYTPHPHSIDSSDPRVHAPRQLAEPAG